MNTMTREEIEEVDEMMYAAEIEQRRHEEKTEEDKMTERQIADRIRATLTVHSDPELARLADELDPTRPEPGTVVWWRYSGNHKYDWHLGECQDYGIEQFGTNDIAKWSDVEYKPARIAGPM